MRRLVSPDLQALRQIESWPVSFAAAGVVTPRRPRREAGGDTAQSVRLASVSKAVAALAVLVAAEEGVVDLDEPAGPPVDRAAPARARLRAPLRGRRADRAARPPPHLLERGLPRLWATHLEERAEMPFADYVRALRLRAARDRARAERRPGGGHARLARRSPRRGSRLRAADPNRPARRSTSWRAVQFPGLSGVLPDYGRFDPLDWGLGVQMRDSGADLDGHARLSGLRSATSEDRGRSSGSTPEPGIACAVAHGPRVR